MTDRDTAEKASRRARRRAKQEPPPEAHSEAPDADEQESDEQASMDEGSDIAGEGQPRPANRRERRAAKAQATEDARERSREVRDAARRRRAQRSKERERARSHGLDTGELVDDALARGTQAASSFLKRNASLVQWLVFLLIIGGIGWQIYSWRRNKQLEKASDQLIEAVRADLGNVGTGGPDEIDPLPSFATAAEREKAAKEAYERAAAAHPGKPIAVMAKLGLAGVLYEQGKYDPAISAYREVRDSKLAGQSTDIRYRAIEGIGLAQEAKGELDAAMKTFKELGVSDVVGFANLGTYHQARLHLAKGDKEEAKQLLSKLNEKLQKDKAPLETSGYLSNAVEELLTEIDPTAVKRAPANLMQDPAQLQELLRQMQQQMPAQGAPTAPSPPTEQ
ncbi:MAG TPA: tetratricopeptide repeat protein [Polyangiaceae bacterium]|nr:tetratricopeptide repeat protein [Polyangiaceae bacterium]